MKDFDEGRVLFNLQRFMIIQTKLNPQTSDKIPDEYVYAWYVKLYPLLNDGEWHEDLEQYFEISKEKIDNVTKYLDEEWQKKRYYNFYEILNYFSFSNEIEININKYDLICILRYLYLHGGFDNEFWNKILEKEKHPIEATAITSEFDSDKIFFI
jgi:hypothetical protein